MERTWWDTLKPVYLWRRQETGIAWRRTDKAAGRQPANNLITFHNFQALWVASRESFQFVLLQKRRTSGVKSPTHTLWFFSPGSSLLLLWFSFQRTGGFVFGIIFPFSLCITVKAIWSFAKLMKPYPAAASENLFFITCGGGLI